VCWIGLECELDWIRMLIGFDWNMNWIRLEYGLDCIRILIGFD